MNIDINNLPFPRLELRWSKTDEGFLCDYLFVISAPDKLDIRSNDDTGPRTIYGARNIEFSMGKTECSGGGYERELLYDADMPTPFRDGCHIIRDSIALKLPAVVTYGDRAQCLTDDPSGEWVFIDNKLKTHITHFVTGLQFDETDKSAALKGLDLLMKVHSNFKKG